MLHDGVSRDAALASMGRGPQLPLLFKLYCIIDTTYVIMLGWVWVRFAYSYIVETLRVNSHGRLQSLLTATK